MTAGTSKSAGLPNITGNFRGRPHATGGNYFGAVMNPYGGAFDMSMHGGENTVPGTTESGTNSKCDYISFDASRSNGIYGASNTVQPPALTMKPFIYTGKTSLNKWLRTA